LAAGAYVLLGALMAREFNTAPRHQLAAAAAVAMTALTLAVGHLFSTTTFDMVTTAAAVWLFVRAMGSEPQRWTPWIAAGVLTGVAMEIKILAAPLLVCCLLGVVICGPRSRLLSPGLWTAVAIALLMAAPNLVCGRRCTASRCFRSQPTLRAVVRRRPRHASPWCRACCWLWVRW